MEAGRDADEARSAPEYSQRKLGRPECGRWIGRLYSVGLSVATDNTVAFRIERQPLRRHLGRLHDALHL